MLPLKLTVIRRKRNHAWLNVTSSVILTTHLKVNTYGLPKSKKWWMEVSFWLSTTLNDLLILLAANGGKCMSAPDWACHIEEITEGRHQQNFTTLQLLCFLGAKGNQGVQSILPTFPMNEQKKKRLHYTRRWLHLSFVIFSWSIKASIFCPICYWALYYY